jgi:hypothetical protein
MNKIKSTFFIAVLLAFTSCVKDVYLDPIDLPDVLTSTVIRVDKFSGNALFSVTNSGLYLQFDDKDYVEFYSGDYSSWSYTQWQQAKIDYSNEKLLATYGSKYILLSRSGITSGDFDNSSLMIRPSSIISPTGVPFHVGYGDITVDNDDKLVYVIYLEKIEQNGTTKFATEMKVSEDNYGSIDLVFNANGDLVITTNPVFVVRDWETDASDFTAIAPSSGFTGYNSIMRPTIVDNVVYGYIDAPSTNLPANSMYKFDLSTKSVFALNQDQFCQFPESGNGILKHLDWNGTTACMLFPTDIGFVGDQGNPLSYIYQFNLKEETCESFIISSNSILQNSSSIADVGYNFDSDTAYIGLNSGLYVYDLKSNEMTLFINSLLSLK